MHTFLYLDTNSCIYLYTYTVCIAHLHRGDRLRRGNDSVDKTFDCLIVAARQTGRVVCRHTHIKHKKQNLQKSSTAEKFSNRHDSQSHSSLDKNRLSCLCTHTHTSKKQKAKKLYQKVTFDSLIVASRNTSWLYIYIYNHTSKKK